MVERVLREGTKKGDILVYALSTCVWCKKTKKFLEDQGIAYDYIFVDLLEDKDREDVVNEIKKWNPNCSFPTVVINNNTCIVGYNEEKILEVLK